jgi:hypothetical protein
MSFVSAQNLGSVLYALCPLPYVGKMYKLQNRAQHLFFLFTLCPSIMLNALQGRFRIYRANCTVNINKNTEK